MTKNTKTVGTLQEIGARVGDVVEFVRPCEGFEFYEEKWVGRKLTMDEEGLKTENGTYGFCNDCVHEFRIVSRATPNYLDGSWHDWHGGECPVPGDVMVEVELDFGDLPGEGKALGLIWSHNGTAADITRFRVVQSNAEAPNSPVGGDEAVDMVNAPPHYTKHPSNVECITITEHMNFCLGNAVKYIWRADMKGGIQDLEKAEFYIKREIALRKGEKT